MSGLLHGVIFSLSLCLPFALPLFAQSTNNKDPDYRLTVSVDLIGVFATVTTAEGALVAGLRQEDFEVFEDGQLQEIALFAKESGQPLRLCLLFDSSASIASELKTQQDAAIEFLQSIFRPGVDRVILQFSDEVEELQRFGSRLESINRAIRSIKPGGGTSLYDAVSLASESLSRQARRGPEGSSGVASRGRVLTISHRRRGQPVGA